MYPTFNSGEIMFVNKIHRYVGEYKRGDVLVFKFALEGDKNDGKYFIKRLIALPGDTIKITDGLISITDKSGKVAEISDDFIKMKDYATNLEYKLAEDEYFMIGDNRTGSYDSRYWGPIKKYQISGKPVFEFWPNLDWNPGNIPDFIKTK
jgi:signal peptidase I